MGRKGGAVKRARVSPERRAFERATLRRLAEAGALPAELEHAQWCLTRGRKTPADDLCAALNKAAHEKAGIEIALRSLRGEPPDFIILNPRTVPTATYHG